MRLVVIGLVAGVFSAFFGVGGGIVIVPLLIMMCGFVPREATATSLGAIGITAFAGVVLYALDGKVDVKYAALVGIPAIAGSLVGTAAQQRLSGRAVTTGFAALLAAIGIWLLVG